MVIELLAGVVTAAAVFCLVYVLSLRTVGVGRGSIAGRLSKYSEVKAAAAETRKSKRERSRATDLIVATVDRAVSNQSFAQNLRQAIARADLRITVGEFLILWGAAIVLGLFLGQVVFGTLIHTIVFTVAGVILPRFYLRFRAGQRLKQFNTQLPDTIVMLANSLRSGYSMMQSMGMVSNEMNPPIATEFQRVIREVGIGLSPEEALNNLLRRINSVDLEIMVMAINVQREIGGNLSIILDTIAHTIRERIRIKGEIKTLTAQATYSGYVISFLPIVLAFVLYTIDHKYIGFFWNDHSCGLPLMCATLFFIAVGFFVMRRITKIEV